MNHLTLKANGQLVAPLEKYVCKSHKEMFYLLTCVHINSSRTHETLRKKSTFYNRGASFNPSHMKRKRKEKMKKNNTSCSFILTLKRNKIPEITSLIWCAQKPIKTIHNLPSKVKIATTIYILGSHHSQSRR